MKLVFEKTKLLQAINIASKGVPSKTTLEIQECFLIDATTDVIKIIGNDLDLGVETIVEGIINERGAIAIDAKSFSDIIRKLPDEEIEIENSEENKVLIKSGKAKFNLSIKNEEEFSRLPDIDKTEKIVISQYTLRETIKQVSFSIADNDANKIMMGILFEVNGNKLRMAALDGHRIAIRNVELSSDYENKKIIIPGRTLNEISKVITGGIEDEVNIYITSKHILFEFDQNKIVTRLIDGEYFDIDRMLSKDYDIRVNINRLEFLSAIERANLLSHDSEKNPLTLLINDNTMEIKVVSAIGSLNESVDIKKDGNDIFIGFNPKYFTDVLRILDSDEVTLYMTNQKAPCYIKDKEETYVYLLLPLILG